MATIIMKEHDIKYCSKCGVGKPATEEYFSIRSDVKQFNAQCRECKTASRRSNYIKNKESILKQSKEWKRNNSEQKKETHKKWYAANRERILQKGRDDYFNTIEYQKERSKKYRDQHKDEINAKRRVRYTTTKTHENELARQWYQKNKDIHLENGNKWRKNNPDAARALVQKYRTRRLNADGCYTLRDVERQKHIQGRECFYCGCSIEDGYHVDHVTPLSKGGSNYCGNIVLTCPSCNLSKNNKYVVEWRKYQRLYQAS